MWYFRWYFRGCSQYMYFGISSPSPKMANKKVTQTKCAMQRKPFITLKYFSLCLYVVQITYW